MWLQKGQQFSRYGRNSHIWLNEPSLWPWTWRQQTNLLAWHFGPWCCITTPSLVSEGSTAEEISSRWTFTGILNLFCDLDHDHNRAIQSFHKTIHLMMMCHQTKFSCKRICSSGYIKSYFQCMIFHCDLDLENNNLIFRQNTPVYDDVHQIKFGCTKTSSSADMVGTVWSN